MELAPNLEFKSFFIYTSSFLSDSSSNCHWHKVNQISATSEDILYLHIDFLFYSGLYVFRIQKHRM